MNEILYADDLVLMTESMENLKEKFLKWQEAFESKGLKVNLKKTKVMVSGSKGEVLKSKVDPCAKCGKRVMANSMMCTKCGKWIHGRCAKMKGVTSTLAKGFVCELCVDTKEGIVERGEKLSFFDQVDFVKSVCYLGDRLNASGESEVAITARTRIGWIKFRECGELLYGRKFWLKIKRRIYQSCVRSVMLYGSETWCLRENEMAILRRTEKVMMRAMCGVKMIEKRRSQEGTSLLGLKDTLDELARVSGVRWYEHVLRRNNSNVLRRALDFKVAERRVRGRSNMTWKRHVEEHTNQIGLKREDAIDRVKWRNGVYKLSRSTR